MGSRNTFAATRRSHRILKALKRGEAIEIGDVTEAFDLEYPQARADLKLLEELYDLSTHREGRTKVWTWDGLNPDFADVATATVLQLGGLARDLFRGGDYERAIERVTDYCRNCVPEGERPRLARLETSFHFRRLWEPRDPDSVRDDLERIVQALRTGPAEWMLGTYRGDDGQVADHVVLPRRLVWYRGRLWLVAVHGRGLKRFDVAGFDDLRAYRPADHGSVGRADTALDGGRDTERGERPPLVELEGEERAEAVEALDETLDSSLEGGFGILPRNAPAEEVHLEVRGEWAQYLDRYRLHQSQTNEWSDESLHVHFEVELSSEFKSFVLGMIPDVRVHAPGSLRGELTDRVESWLENRSA